MDDSGRITDGHASATVLLAIGWILFGVSLWLPAWSWTVGWEALWLALFETTNLGAIASALTNVLLPVATFAKRARWALPALAGAAAFNVLYWTGWAMNDSGSVDDLLIGWAMNDGGSVDDLLIGYWCWIASFALVALGVRRRNRTRMVGQAAPGT